MSKENKAILQKLDELNSEIRDIQFTLKNETNHSIELIAEGYKDMSRKLDSDA